VDDSEGIGSDRDTRTPESIDAYRDPRLDRRNRLIPSGFGHRRR
jgi:hypothetical protein